MLRDWTVVYQIHPASRFSMPPKSAEEKKKKQGGLESTFRGYLSHVTFRKWMDNIGGIEKYFARPTKGNFILARDFGKHLRGMPSILKVRG